DGLQLAFSAWGGERPPDDDFRISGHLLRLIVAANVRCRTLAAAGFLWITRAVHLLRARTRSSLLTDLEKHLGSAVELHVFARGSYHGAGRAVRGGAAERQAA